MAETSHIEWTDATWNPVTGCSVVSPGCTNCYAMKLAGTRLQHHPSRAGLTVDTKAGPVWTGEVRLNEEWLDQPMRWRRGRRIFVCAHGDLFHEKVPDAWLVRIFEVMAAADQHIFQVLTKRSDRMREFVAGMFGCGEHWPVSGAYLPAFPLPNVWLGVSVEDQQRADDRREDFRATPAAVKFVSYEPAIGPVDWSGWEFVQQIISGGESGHKARPNHPAWHRDTRDFCAPRGIAYFFKQWGEWGPDTGPDQDRDREGYRRDRIMEGAGPCTVLVDGAWRMFDNGYAAPIELCSGHGEFVYRLGKKRNGRLLDGELHDAFPIPPDTPGGSGTAREAPGAASSGAAERTTGRPPLSPSRTRT